MRALLPIFFISLLSCIHTPRNPAAEQPPVAVACGQGFQNLGIERTAGRGEDFDRRPRAALGQVRFLKDVYLPELKNKLPGLFSQKGCEREDTINEFNRILADWNEFMKADAMRATLLKLLDAQLKNGPLVNDPKYGAKLSCAYACSDAAKCADKCRAQDFKAVNAVFDFDSLKEKCSEKTPEGLRLQSAEFEKYYSVFMPQTLKIQRENSRLAHALLEAGKKTDKEMRAMAVRMREFKPKAEACPFAPTELEKKMEAFVVQIEGLAGTGSGFLTKSENSLQLVTAFHVFSDEPQLSLENQKAEIFFRQDFRDRKSVGRPIVFKPKNFHRMADVFFSEFAEERPALAVAPLGKLPQKGQKFFAVGFVGLGPQLRAIPCAFYGFIQGSQGHGTNYILRCQPGASHFNGMSGGPLVDENGTVWGVNTNGGVLASSNLIVSPLRTDSRGVLSSGLPQLETSDLCVKSDDWSVQERCQLMENQYETQVP